MIETEGTKHDSNPMYGNDPFFNGNNDYDQTNLDNFDNNDFLEMFNDDQGFHHQNENDEYGLDDLQLTTDTYLTSLNNKNPYLSPTVSTSSDGQNTTTCTQPSNSPGNADCPPPPSPVVIDPNEIDKISIQLEKNQQCRCKSCNKLFNSVWYLKQHAVKHSNDRPFKCKFCLKTYKFRSNLYQHKCPERNRQLGGPGGIRKRFYARGIAYTEIKQAAIQSQKVDDNMNSSIIQKLDPIITDNNNFQDTVKPTETIEQYSNNDNEQQFNNSFKKPQNNYNFDFELIPVEQNIQPIQQQQPEQQEFIQPIIEDEPKQSLTTIRERPLNPEYLENYLSKNKQKLFTCRKCKLQFPTKEHLLRHTTGHTIDEFLCFLCPQCPQKFCDEKKLINHLELHSRDSIMSHKCKSCEGNFRSALALRRHRDQCRMCCIYPYGNDPQMYVNPIDPYGFVESDDEIDKQQKSTSSTPKERLILEEEYDEDKSSEDDYFTVSIKRTKKTSENDDADSGFRSRLNSTQSCSPGATSSHSSGSDSPGRKDSTEYPGTSGYNKTSMNYTNLVGSCVRQNHSSTITNQNPVINCSYAMIEPIFDDSDYLEVVYSEDGLLLKKPFWKKSKLLNPSKGILTTIDVDEFALSCHELSSDLGDFNNNNNDDKKYPFIRYDMDLINPDEKILKIILAIFLNILLINAKNKANRSK